MKALILTILALFLAAPLRAQTVIVVGPASVLEWQVPGVGSPANAQLLTYGLIVDTGTPKILTGVTCAQGPAANQTCSALAAGNVPIGGGTHTLTMTASDGVTTSLPSTPFSYVTLIVPIPISVRIR